MCGKGEIVWSVWEGGNCLECVGRGKLFGVCGKGEIVWSVWEGGGKGLVVWKGFGVSGKGLGCVRSGR